MLRLEPDQKLLEKFVTAFREQVLKRLKMADELRTRCRPSKPCPSPLRPQRSGLQFSIGGGPILRSGDGVLGQQCDYTCEKRRFSCCRKSARPRRPHIDQQTEECPLEVDIVSKGKCVPLLDPTK